MEVFHMNRYEIDKINRATNAPYGSDHYYKNRPNTYRSENRQWDYIIGIACTGCGKIMNRYDARCGFAFCFNCRSFLFSERNNLNPSRFEKPNHDRFW